MLMVYNLNVPENKNTSIGDKIEKDTNLKLLIAENFFSEDK